MPRERPPTGRELSSVIDLDSLGGLVTKAVSVERRHGARAPRVAEFEGGMINAVGLANPESKRCATSNLPWLAQNVRRARVIVNVVGQPRRKNCERGGDARRLERSVGLRAECELPER